MIHYNDFIEQVQAAGKVGSFGETEAAVRATLTTLSERLHDFDLDRLASQLPDRVGEFLQPNQDKKQENNGFSLQGFYYRISHREHVEAPEAARHARSVMAAIAQCVNPDDLDSLRAELSEDYQELFAPATVARH